jgi:hypothetical protein
MDITAIVIAVIATFGVSVIGWLLIELRRTRAALESVVSSGGNMSPDEAAALLGQIAGAAVLAAQQIYEANQGEEKLAYAKQYIEDYLEEFGITLDIGLVVGAIEAAVFQAKREYGDDWL